MRGRETVVFEVVTCGEPMVLFSPGEPGPLRHVSSFSRHVAGAELNLSVALSRLGVKVGYATRVGADEFGRCVLATMRAEGLDTRLVRIDPHRRTGVYFKEYAGLGDPRVYYYREGSAASILSPDDIDQQVVASARLVHLTGILPLLSASCRATAEKMASLARASGVPLSFDPNVRLRLVSRERVPEVMAPFVEAAQILLLNQSELELVLGETDPLVAARRFQGSSLRLLVVKKGAAGALAVETDTLALTTCAAFTPPRYVDPVGAGDGFDAGFLFGYLRGWSLQDSLRLGNYVGAMATTVDGDYEGYPTYPEIAAAGLLPAGKETERGEEAWQSA